MFDLGNFSILEYLGTFRFKDLNISIFSFKWAIE